MNIQSIGLFVAVCGGVAALSSQASAETYLCESGKGMKASEMVTEFIILARTAGSTPAAAGECATKGSGEPLFQGGELNLHIGFDVGGVQNLVAAIGKKGTTFSVQGTKSLMNEMTVINVTSIGDVQVAGGGGNNDDNVGDAGDDMPADDEGGNDNAGNDDGGNDGGAVASADCPAGSATVTTAEAGFDVLNIREKPSKNSEIVMQVPDGSEVTISGACTTSAGAGFAKGKGAKKKAGSGASAWCRVEEPAEGCAMAQFLNFGAGVGDNGAGFAKKRKKSKG